MSRGLVIPAVPFLPLTEQDFLGLGDFQEAVQGYIEPVQLGSPQFVLYVNEEGKQRQMSINTRATVLWWLLTPDARGRDLIVGDAVLVEEGAEASDFFQSLQRQRDFRIMVRLEASDGAWVEGPRSFATWFDAATFALALTERFAFVRDVRVCVAS